MDSNTKSFQNKHTRLITPIISTYFLAIALAALAFGSSPAQAAQTGSVIGWGAGKPAGNDFTAIAAGRYHNLALKADGSIVAWGYNDYGECNIPSPNTDFIAVAAGDYHSLGLKEDGSIVAWGYNYSGQCDVPSPNSGFTAVAGGGHHSLALKADGSIVAWGRNNYGQCNITSPNTDFVAIAAGYGHSFGLKADGSIVAWGRNNYGQCNVPSPNSGFIAVAAGDYHSLGLKADGSIVAWGYNGYGQCNIPSPNTDFVAIAAGRYHSLGLKADGSIVAWGRNNSGQCDIPSPNTDFIAVTAGAYHSLGLKADGSIVALEWSDYGQCNIPSPNSGFIAVAAGRYHSLGLKADGSIVAWGGNSNGQCNIPSPNTDFIAVAASDWHSLGLKADGSIVAWGRNNSGQCNVPSPNSGFTAVATGNNHSLGLKQDGSIVAWGSNYSGQCDVPSPNSDFIAVAAAGSGHSLGLKADGSVAAWGYNFYGQCNIPSPNTNFVAVAAGGYHSLGLQADGSIVAWGHNDRGQANPPAGNDFVIIAAGVYHSLALKQDGSIVAWGYNYYGQATPPAGNDFIAIAAGDYHSLAIIRSEKSDLLITSEDITFGAYPAVPGEPNSISATVWNVGNIPAVNIEVSFSDSGGPIGSQIIPIIGPNDSNTVSIQHSWPDEGFQLITVAVDPANNIEELNETNNTASKLYQVGDVPDMNANVIVESNPPRTWPEGSTANINGEAFYRIQMTGYTDLEYPLKGGSVSARVVHPSYPSGQKQLTGLYTDAQGRFGISFPVPGQAGDIFDVNIMATDGTYTGTWGPEQFHVKDYMDLWVYPEDINFSNANPSSGEVVDINTTVHTSSENTQLGLNVPVTLNVYPPASGNQIDSQIIPRISPGDSNTVSSSWSSSAEGLYCIEAILGPGYSDDDNGNNRAMRPVMVGPLPNSIDVVIETPPVGADVNASQTTTVNVSVTDDNGNAIIPCALETLSLQFTGSEQRGVSLKDYFNWDTEKYVYQWKPEVDTNGLTCLEVTAQTVDFVGSLTDSNQTCVDVNDDVPPTFRIYAYPYWVRTGQTVRFYVYSSELLLNDEPNVVTVTDSNGQPIDFSLVAHSSSTRWVYETNELPEQTARGTATIDVNGTDIHGNVGSGHKHFIVVDVVPDLWVHSEDISFFDSNGFIDVNPDLGETITIEALVHASSLNTDAVNDVPVTFTAHHIAGDYDIGGTQYIAQILPDTFEPADVNWTNAAEGVYIIEVELGPGFSDDNGGNNNATRAILVGDIPFVAVFDVNERSRIGRTWFRYKCWVELDNLSPLAIENVQLELIDMPDNIDINDPCVSYAYVDVWGTATSEDSSDYCIIDVNRVEQIEPAEIIWQITYDIAGAGQSSQQMSSTMVQLEPIILAGDVTGNDEVNFEDLAILAEQWLQIPGVPSADVAPWPGGDGIVNFRDFAVVAENWMK